jgi:hypothetical protein
MDGSPAFVHRMVAIPKRGDDISSAGDEYSIPWRPSAMVSEFL